MRKAIYLVLILIVTSACLKEEIPIESHAIGSLVTNQIELGVDYRYQVYYDFETNTMVKQHLKTDWDLGFENGGDGFRVILNISKAMSSASKPIAYFESTTDTSGCQWGYDVNSGNLDSTAISDWQSLDQFYIIDLGYSYDGTHLGFKKLKILSLSDNEYNIEFESLDGSNAIITSITKNSLYNFSFFSFETNNIVEIEPKKNDWDLVFGQYAHLFEPTFPYLVTGVLSNRNGVEVAEVFDKSFEDIQYSDVSEYYFSDHINIIGYDWKTYNGGSYTVDITKNYIVKTTEGLYFKIHFTDFYNQQGDKGSPMFELSSL